MSYKIEMTGSPKKHGFLTKQEFLDKCNTYCKVTIGKFSLKNGNVNYLITDDINSNTQKMKNAKRWTVKISDYSDFIGLLKHRVNTDPLKEVKKDIHKYLNYNGYDIEYDELYKENEYNPIDIDLFNICKTSKGEDNQLLDDWEDGNRDKYFLEYIGSILRKNNIKEILLDGTDEYNSTKWTFDTIDN
ncbi:hypothetical protein COB55_03650 [Candidatus Wolfebacteria bacterium]|nr:MAG: hypothetical protein COB55_03650 [Candidatus Wolfebacteria bacterium]